VSSLILPGQSELSDIQRVIKVGPYVQNTFNEGDWVKINFRRFWKPKEKKSLKDGNEFSTTDMEFFIPVLTFNNEDYLEIDQGDVEYYWDKDTIG
jgi:hypothetical protein